MQTDGLDLLKVPWGNCVYYNGDYVPYNSSHGSSMVRSLDRMQTLFPAKAVYRGELINNALGFVERFDTFLSTVMKQTLIDPLAAVTANPNIPTGIGSKLNNILAEFQTLRQRLDSQDQRMVTAVAQAWNQDKQALTNAAGTASSVMRQSETTGTSLVNQEMQQMYQIANSQARNNDRDISRLAKMEIQQSNSTVRSVTQQANQLYRAANATITRANALYSNMNATLSGLQDTISRTALSLRQAEDSVITQASSKFVQGQNASSTSQTQAASLIDRSLEGIATSVSSALNSLTTTETRNLTALTNNLTQVLTRLSQSINTVQGNLQSALSSIQSAADSNFSSTLSQANTAFQQVSTKLSTATSGLASANTSFISLQGGVQSQFATLDTNLQQSFANVTQVAQLKESNLESYMQTQLNSFTGFALNQTNASSAQLASAYEAAMAAATGGSSALSLTFEQRQKLITALQGWQKEYAGNTNQLAAALTSTYGGLITDTTAQLQQAIEETSSQIAALTADQRAQVEQAIAAAQGNPSQLSAILAQFGLVGARAAAAAEQLQGGLNTSAAGYQRGMSDANDMLADLQAAADATGGSYVTANALNANATRIAQAAVYNTSRRIGLMNSLMQQYSAQLSAQILNASSAAEQAANSAGNNASSKASANIQAKMALVQQALANAIATGQTSASDLANFAASVGANATMLSDLAAAVQSDSSDAVARIVQAKSDAINQLKDQVGSQLSAVSDTFASQAATEQSNLGALIAGLHQDLTTQSGAKAKRLTDAQALLQTLYASMTTSASARSQAQKTLDDSFTAALGNATLRMAQLTQQITQQKAGVSSAISAVQRQIEQSSSAVNGTIAQANASAQADVEVLRNQGKQQVAAVQKVIADSAATVEMMVSRFENVIAKNMDSDMQQRVKENSEELSLLLGVKSTLNSSQAAQASSLAQTQLSQVQRAQNLASIIANLSGAGLAAQNGSAAFQAYVVSLANQTGVNMADLVNAMKAQVSDQKSGLYKLLQSNNLFVNETLGSLAAASAGIQQGVMTGASAVMAQIQASMNKGNAVVAGQKAQMGSLTQQANQVVGISSQQLVQLMTILTSQNALQQSSAFQANKAVFTKIAGLADALSISTNAMNAASNATNDAIEVAGNATDDVEAFINALIQATIAAATVQEQSYLDPAQQDYAAIMTALKSAQGFADVHQNQLQTIQDDMKTGEGEIEANIAQLNSQITALQNTVESNTLTDLSQLNNWAQQAGPYALNVLSRIQSAASAAALTSTTLAPTTTTTTARPTR